MFQHVIEIPQTQKDHPIWDSREFCEINLTNLLYKYRITIVLYL